MKVTSSLKPYYFSGNIDIGDGFCRQGEKVTSILTLPPQYLKMSPIFQWPILQPEPKVKSLLQQTITRLFIDSSYAEGSYAQG